MITDTMSMPMLQIGELAPAGLPIELAGDELDTVAGGFIPVAVAVVGGAFLAGVAVGAAGAGIYKWAQTSRIFSW